MNEPPTPPRPMTPNQMRAIVYKIARTYLEVERGLRPVDQLSSFLTKAEFRRHRVTRRGSIAASRPVRPTDIGRVRLDAATPGRVSASVMVRRDDDRWSALLVDLKQTGRGWQVERLDRLERLVPREPRHVVIDEDALDRRRRFVENERQTVDVAFRAAQSRYDQIPDKRARETKPLRVDRDRWRARLEELQGEAASLDQGRLQADLPIAREPLSSDEHARAQAGVETILGPRPDEPHRADVWDQAEQALASYGDRWKLESPTDLLRAADAETQDSDRRDLLQQLAQTAQALDVSSTRSLDPAFEVREHGPVSIDW